MQRERVELPLNQKKCSACDCTEDVVWTKEGMYLCKTCLNSTSIVDQSYKEIINSLKYGLFTQAKSQIEKISVQENNRAFLDYARLRAKFKIMGPILIKDVINQNNEVENQKSENYFKSTGCFTPCNVNIFSMKKYEQFFEFKKLLNDYEIKEILKSLESSTNEFKPLCENIPEVYDVFICHKTEYINEETKKTEKTNDFDLAKKIYKELTSHGLKVFLAPITKNKEKKKVFPKLIDDYNSNWRKWIYNALLKSKIMVVIASNKEYLEAPNVANEWVTFSHLSESEFFGKKKIFPVFSRRVLLDLVDVEYQSYFENSYAKEALFDSFIEDASNIKSFAESIVENKASLDNSFNFYWKEEDLLDEARYNFLNGKKETIQDYPFIPEKYFKGDYPLYCYLCDRFYNKEAIIKMGIYFYNKGQFTEAKQCFEFLYGNKCIESLELLNEEEGIVYLALCEYRLGNIEFAKKILLNNTSSEGIFYQIILQLKDLNQLSYEQKEDFLCKLSDIREEYYPAKELIKLLCRL